MPSIERFQDIGLYGGAISVQIPTDFIDASQFREIPDTQEVFVNTRQDDSIVFDLMERVEATNDQQALKDHLSEISEINNNGSQFTQLYNETRSLVKPMIKKDSSPAYITVAIEPAKKWGKTTELEQKENVSDEEKVLDEPLLVLILVLIRLQSVETDLLVTYNTPITRVVDLQKIQTTFGKLQSNQQELDTNTSNLPVRIREGISSLRNVIDSIEVNDWSLFAWFL